MINGNKINTHLILTDLCLLVKCKCGSTLAANMICGGEEIDAYFTHTVAKIHKNGGEASLVKISETTVVIEACKCDVTTLL